jgi:hypothetical protein
LAVSLVLLVVGCGGRSTPSSPAAVESPTPAANTGKLTIRFKDWT